MFGKAVVIHGDEYARMSAALDKAEALNKEMAQMLTMTRDWLRSIDSDGFVGDRECHSDYLVFKIDELLAKYKEGE